MSDELFKRFFPALKTNEVEKLLLENEIHINYISCIFGVSEMTLEQKLDLLHRISEIRFEGVYGERLTRVK